LDYGPTPSLGGPHHDLIGHYATGFFGGFGFLGFGGLFGVLSPT
jgi:hypothetical protein